MDHEHDFETYLAHERARYAKEHAGIGLYSQFGVLILTTVLMWTTFDSSKLLLWFFGAVTVSLVSFFWLLNLTVESPYFTVRRWKVARVATSFLVGMSWAIMPVFFFSYDDVWFIAIIVAIYTGYISGALSVNVTFQESLLAFVLGITIPFFCAMFFREGTTYQAIAGLSIFYTTAVLYVSRGSSKLFINGIRRQYENEILLKELAREKETVEQAVRAKDRFLASASHDLRQPLNAIRLFVEALGPMQHEPLGNEILTKVRKSLKGLNSMLHSLLDISKLDARAIDNNPKDLNLDTIVAQLYDEYKEKAPHLEFERDIENDITVVADVNILHRVIRNLIDNAVKYTPEGGIKISALVEDDQRVILSISDSGIGIPEDKLSLVFEEFEQLGNPERNREKGLGLGLAIVRRLCSIADIGIELHSTYGEGTTVTLTMLNGSLDNEHQRELLTTASVASKFVLMVDDNPDVLASMEHLLRSWGCAVLPAESISDALLKLSVKNKVPDLIISDLRLRDGEEGDDLIELIRQEYNKDIPAMLVTGDTAPKRITRIKESGLVVIYKPIEPDDLFRKMTELLSQ